MTIETRSPSRAASQQAMLSGQQREVRADDGATLGYVAFGSGPCNFLFLHGWGGAGSRSSWVDPFGYLDLAGLQVILMDQRGHGRSEQTARGFSTEQLARDVLAIADHVEARQFVTVAYSMSSKWAQWLACTAPGRVLGQVLVAPVPASDMPVPDEEVERWLAVARSGDRGTFDEWARPWTKDPLPADILDGYFADVTRTSQVTLKATADVLTRGGTFLDRLQHDHLANARGRRSARCDLPAGRIAPGHRGPDPWGASGAAGLRT